MTQKQLKVSVIIPAYNEEERITNCLDSLMHQSVKPYEIIVVDNNSIDQTAVIAQNFGVKVLRQKRQGRDWAQMLGFDKAKGNILARIDADTIVSSDWVEKVQQAFTQYQTDAITGYGHSRTGISVHFLSKVFSWVYYNHSRAYFGTEMLWGSNMAMTKDIWLTAKHLCNTGINLHEDQDLALAISSVGGRIKVVPSLEVSVDFNDIQYFDKYHRYNKMKRYVKIADSLHPRFEFQERLNLSWPKRIFLHLLTIEFIYGHYLLSFMNSYSKQLVEYSKLSSIFYWYKNL